jgi:prevent-host-death family protein
MSAHRRKVALVDATEAKNRFGAVIKRAYEQEEHVIVRRGGLPVVAIIPVQDYEQLISAAQGEALSPAAAPEVAAALRAAAARVRLRDFLAAAQAALPPAAADPAAHQAVEQEIDAAVKAVRRSARRGPANGAALTARTARARAVRRR